MTTKTEVDKIIEIAEEIDEQRKQMKHAMFAIRYGGNFNLQGTVTGRVYISESNIGEPE